MRARLVERLGVSAPTVSETVARLEREGLLSLDERRLLRLTDRGRQAATGVMRRHRLAERLLVDILQVPWSQVHEEAHRLEHAISETLEPYLVKALGDPGSCPHGNPIPGSVNVVDITKQVGLSEVAVGRRVVIRRIDEALEAQPSVMRTLEDDCLTPGSPAEVLASGPQSLQLRTDAGDRTLPTGVAAKVYVSDCPASHSTPAAAAAVADRRNEWSPGTPTTYGPAGKSEGAPNGSCSPWTTSTGRPAAS